ncbi:patatin-like phospholipase family protein [Hymenobacter aquaticus]|uniref:Patatin-like phospholipase family protein n=1 Tax=Hymenobacter aquaticus TaxID=1867101 RepID=A0A4Z0Q7G9_9BACT|nr:patatin-like phospholipase family protein [Hymenobacter aquaticus]TGE25349.1 patatin-like phospholipase family protein [Hymenobacter aquaticus]
MTTTSNYPHALGLALSGGGYRAAAFHLGTLRKLHELGILPHVEVLSTISGGSITGAAYCLNGQTDYPAFHARMHAALRQKSVIGYVLRSAWFIRGLAVVAAFLVAAGWLLFSRYAPWAVLVLAGLVAVLLRYQFALFPISQEIERAYDQFFFQGATLAQLPARPLMAIGSSNLQTGRPFTFSQTRMGDSAYTAVRSHTYHYGLPPVRFVTTGFPVARAVMASSCVPFAFTPVRIARTFFQQPTRNSEVVPQLIDGGVYDNQGIQKITQPGSGYECRTVISSDAGAGLPDDEAYTNTIGVLVRTVDLFMNRIKNVQMSVNLYRNVELADRPIAFLSLGWRLANCIPGFVDNCLRGDVLPEVLLAHGFDSQGWQEVLERYRQPGQAEQVRAWLIERTEQQIGYAELAARDLTDAAWNIARTTPTNLTPLTDAQLEGLIRQGENLTELQVKLYCPHLLQVSSPAPVLA